MSAQFVIIDQILFDNIRVHCETCTNFEGAREALSNWRVVSYAELTIIEHPLNLCGESPKKRKTTSDSQPNGKKVRLQQPVTFNSELSNRLQDIDTTSKDSQPNTDSSCLETPQSSQQTSTTINGESNTPVTILRVIDNFNRKVPHVDLWSKAQRKLAESARDYEDIIEAFVSKSCVIIKNQLNTPEGHSKDPLLLVGETLASLVHKSIQKSHLQKSFANFQVLIFLSYCEFLSQTGAADEIIDYIVQRVAKLGKNERSLRRGSRLINECIVSLVRNGWTIYRATELFFIGISALLSAKCETYISS